ncbi:SgcJ/EcaC family oxidoreductase [Microbispora corallina]|uniref:DUF4440 domain-containing protein n=1 Tax=Microbispora corallina TaxID=83302 RepID=A0ABQ4FYS8_9ACTN|nr:SgcJ/EcaC family oxidoreductase [Microbispora corallina]GIH39986.1 hypothetical protein Mco01_29860 [Microbispora corallina]
MPVNSPTTVAVEATAAAAVPQRVIAAWADNDAAGFASVFTEHATMILPGDVFVTGRDRIRAYMEAAYAGPYAGSRVTGTPLAIRRLSDDLVLMITRGGVIEAGQTELAPGKAVRASWLLARVDGEWLVTAYQNTPISAF